MNVPPVQFTRTSDGVSIAYTVAGSGPPLVLCWGCFNTHTALRWRSPGLRVPTERLSAHFTVYEFDWRNTGSSTRGVPFGREEWLRDLEAVFALFDEPANLVVYSPAAVPYVACNPERIRRLVTWNQAALPARNPIGASFISYSPLFSLDPDWVRIYARKFAGDIPESIIREFEELYVSCCDADYRSQATPIPPSWDQTPYLEQIAVPTLVVQRRNLGGGLGSEIGAGYAAKIPGAQLYLVEGSSILMPGEDDPIPRIVAFLTGDDEPLPTAPRAGGAANGLSPREIEVLVLLARGHTNQQIALALGIAPSTVGTHIRHIFEKHGYSSRAEAAAAAVRNGVA
jgi:DNA-binding CsgD family transcriptional regulator/pimeloyl-ACP methyl ester carboxylesterase